MQAKKAIFLGVRTFHSSKKDKDFRQVEIYTPVFSDERGFKRGGVQSFFTALDSTIGNGLAVGTIVKPEFSYDLYSNYAELSGLTVVAKSPYSPDAFN